jgi:hypothetical protein
MNKYFSRHLFFLSLLFLPLNGFADVHRAKEIGVIKSGQYNVLTCGFEGKQICFSTILPINNQGNSIVDMLGKYDVAAIGFDKKIEESTSNIESLVYDGLYSISATFKKGKVVVTSKNRFESPENLIIWFAD